MKIGIIGAGAMGATLAGQLIRLGHEVCIANSRRPETLAEVAAQTGATAVTAQQAAQHGEIVVVAIPRKSVPTLPAALFAEVGREVVVVDAGNYYPLLHDGRIPTLEEAPAESEWVQWQLGRPVIKAFNTIAPKSLHRLGRPAGTAGRVGLPVAGDHAAHKQRVMHLIETLGFDPVDGGRLRDSWRQQPGTPVYGTDLPAPNIGHLLSLMGPARTAAQVAQFTTVRTAQEVQVLEHWAAH